MKSYTKGAKLRAKKALPRLAETPKRKSRGATRMREIHADPEAERTVLQARARQMGVKPKDMTEMKLPALSEAAGRAIYSIHGGDAAKRLWDSYCGYTAAEAVYLRHYLGARLHAKTARVEYLIETFEARPDDRPDLRDDEQRSRDAANSWAIWQGYMMHLPRHQQQAITDVAYGDVQPMDAGQVTTRGVRFVEAVRALADVVEEKS